MLLVDEKFTLAANVPPGTLQVSMRQPTGHGSGGNGSTVFSSTLFESSHVSVGACTAPSPQTCGTVVVVVVGPGTVEVIAMVVVGATVVLVVAGIAPAVSTWVT